MFYLFIVVIIFIYLFYFFIFNLCVPVIGVTVSGSPKPGVEEVSLLAQIAQKLVAKGKID